jgi:ribonuclease BN (tRNA processing enzyme)
MKVITYGTRGSMAVSSKNNARYGGNTTCVQVESDCIPDDMAFAIDCGTGLFRLSADTIEKRPRLAVIQTHWHQDHLTGLAMAPHVLYESGQMHLYGPEENGFGPEDAMKWAMMKPVFPVEYAQVKHRVKCRKLGNPGNQVIVVHPKAGIHLLSMSRYKMATRASKQLQLGDRRHDASECLVISMYKNAHPDFAISYRFEEKPTGRVFVFLTDHEKLADHPKGLVDHVRGAHLLIQDAQYTEEEYATRTAGFGHGTPEYCVELAIRGGVEKLALTHHDPMADDAQIDRNVEVARSYSLRDIESVMLDSIFAAADYMKIAV